MFRIGRPREEEQVIPKMPPVATGLIFQTVSVFSVSRTITEYDSAGISRTTYTSKKFYHSCKDAFQAGATRVDKDDLLECNGHYFLVAENKIREVEFDTEYQVSSFKHRYPY